MSAERTRELTRRAEELHKRLLEVRKRSRYGVQRLSEVSGDILGRVAQFDDAALTAINDLDPAAHTRAFQAAVEARIESFRQDFDRVAGKAQALPRRIEALASGETLATIEESLVDLRDELTVTFDTVAGEVEETLVTDAFLNPAEAMTEEFEASAGLIRETTAETTTRLETLAETMVEMADGVGELAESVAGTLVEAWANRAEIMDGVFEGHVLNMGARTEALESRFETVRDRLVATFATLSALRVELTELSIDNAGPSDTLADVLSAASDTLGAVS